MKKHDGTPAFPPDTGRLTQRRLLQTQEKEKNNKDLDPTRYGDWEYKGRCIDF